MSNSVNSVSSSSKIFYYSPTLSKDQKTEFKSLVDDIAKSESKKTPEMISRDLLLISMKLDTFQSSWNEKEDTEELKKLVNVFNQNVKYCNLVSEELAEARNAASPSLSYEEFYKSAHQPGRASISSQYPDSGLRFLDPKTPAYEEEKERVLRAAYRHKIVTTDDSNQQKFAKYSECKLLSPYIINVTKKIFDTVQKLEINGLLKEVDFLPIEELNTSGNLFNQRLPKLRECEIKAKPITNIEEPIKASQTESNTEVSEASTVSQSEALPTTVRVSIDYRTGWGKAIGICCESNEWKEPIYFTYEWNKWSGEVPTGKDWKFVILQEGKVVQWENRKDGNRNTKVGDDLDFTGKVQF